MTITEGARRVGNIVDALVSPTALQKARSIANAFFESEVPGNGLGVPACATGAAVSGSHPMGDTDWAAVRTVRRLSGDVATT